MRSPERPDPVDRPALGQLTEQAPDLSHLERLVQLERRQNARQAPGEHRLAGAGRPAHQDVVPAGRGDLERTPCLLLAVDLAEVVLRRIPGGARLTVRRRAGNGRPLFRMAERTRSRASLTEAAARPTRKNFGSPLAASAWTSTRRPSIPASRHESTVASNQSIPSWLRSGIDQHAIAERRAIQPCLLRV